MDPPRYRIEGRPVALNARKHPEHDTRSFPVRIGWKLGVLTALLIYLALSDASKPPPTEVAEVGNEDPTPVVTRLADTRILAARAEFDQGRPAEALALLAAAIKADPASGEAASMARDILTRTRWHLPETSIPHPAPVDQLEFAPPQSLWVSLGGAHNTTVRWDTGSLAIGSVLFPLRETTTRSLIFDAGHRHVVIERAGISLLCDAQTLKPVRALGRLPDFVTPPSVVVFSPDGLLMAHPEWVSDKDRSIIWRIRDTGSGEIIRSSEPILPAKPKPLTAFLTREKQRVLHADGGLLEIPLSPVEDVISTPPEKPVTLAYAQFSDDGGSALALRIPGPHREPEPFIIRLGGGGDASLEPSALLARFPWDLQPGLWTGLLRDPERSPVVVEGNAVDFPGQDIAPIHTASAPTAAATTGDHIITGEMSGLVTMHRQLPQPVETCGPPLPTAPDPDALAALHELVEGLAGVTFDETGSSFPRSEAGRRVEALKGCDFGALGRIFPMLDFSGLASRIGSFGQRTASPKSLLPLTGRIARATAGSNNPKIEAAFAQDPPGLVPSTIRAAGGRGPDAAKALELALASEHPEWIAEILKTARDLPPLLRHIAESRIAWLEGRKADAITGWADDFPDLAQVRLREDWDGWEQADYQPALDKLRACISEELATLELPENPTEEQRAGLIARLTDPATLKSVGAARFGDACLKAALALSAYPDHSEDTFRLASIARNYGQSPAPCLRAEATALSALQQYDKAHERWIELITEQPVETHHSGDYAEAAYTAFENANPKQAMAILTSGIQRFPNDSAFAMRAGWVALLTGNPDNAYRFLLAGQRIGYAEEKLENATALMAIAAAQSGAIDEAGVFYQDLIRMDPAWEDPATIDTLQWPEDMKAALRLLTW